VRAKNTSNILLNNTIDCCVVAICFYLLGYGFAFGENNGKSNGFIGAGDFALKHTQTHGMFHMFFFQWAVASAAVTIAAGALAERCKMEGYIIYTVIMATFVYPICAHWCACRHICRPCAPPCHHITSCDYGGRLQTNL
jgi:ammonium transporter, Amt family